MTIRKDKRSHGFTLVEVIISVLLFALVILLFGTILSAGLGFHKNAIERTEQEMLGAKNIESQDTIPGLSGQIVALQFGGDTIEVEGDYQKDKDGSRYQYFEPNGLP